MKKAGATAALTVLCWTLLAAPAQATPGPEWRAEIHANADYFLSGRTLGVYKFEAENTGTGQSGGELHLRQDIPPGLNAKAVSLYLAGPTSPESKEGQIHGADLGEFNCVTDTECSYPGILSEIGIDGLQPGERLLMFILVEIPTGVEGPLEDIGVLSSDTNQLAEGRATNMAAAVPPPGLLHFSASAQGAGGEPYTQAGGHPFELTTEFRFETFSSINGVGGGWATSGTAPVPDPKNVVVDLPPGLIANPQGVPSCSLADYFTQECETSKVAVGNAGVQLFGWSEGAFRALLPVYNLTPSAEFPGQLGLTIAGLPVIMITTSVRDGSDYGVSATSLAAQADLTRIRLNLWGVPADESHDHNRGEQCFPGRIDGKDFSTATEDENYCNEGPAISAGVPLAPFITMPTECSGQPLFVTGRYDSWQHPGEYAQAAAELPPLAGCNNLQFHPSVEVQPTTSLADAPSGLNVHLRVPQSDDSEGVAAPSLKRVAIRLPQSLTLDPPVAGGLVGCTEAQIGLHSETPSECPDASKLGTALVRSPLLNSPLTGSVFLATPYQNPTKSLLAGYLSVSGHGIRIKLVARIDLDLTTGRITSSFDENPQLPVEEVEIHFFEGARGVFRTPAVCGSFRTTTELVPFSAPESGPPATPSDEFSVTEPEDGGPCPRRAAEEPHAPRFRAGSELPRAGAYSTFSLRIAREDGSQEFDSFEATLPAGLNARLAEVPYCPDIEIAAASGESGAQEQVAPSCPKNSEVGTVSVLAGAGPTPLNVSGHVYLAGPYKGAPLSLVFITPVLAGPFDLGTTVVRAAVYLDPNTVQNRVVSDQLPTILRGIPLDIRSITVALNRQRFMLNPTSCDEAHIIGNVSSVTGSVTLLSQRFQLGDCAALAFKPKLKLSLSGGVHRNGHPRLRAVVRPTPGDANLSSTQVTLPPTELVDNSHLQEVCSSSQFEANECPKSSIYGHARAETPLLSEPLEGPVFLQPSTHRVPDLIAALHSGAFAINVHLHARQDSVEERIRTTFENIPDVPLTRFVLNMDGGKKGLLVNSKDLCAERHHFRVRMRGQNGKVFETEPLLRVACGRHKTGS